MKYIKSLLATLLAAVMLSGCSDFGDINENPNSPVTDNTNMMYLYSARYAMNLIMNSSTYDPWLQEWTGYIAETKNNQFGPMNTTNDYSTTYWYVRVIRNLTKIIELNENEETKSLPYVTAFGDNAAQIAVAKTLRSFYYMSLTDILGPIVYSEAYKGESDEIWMPKYDSQEAVYAGLEQELNDAYAMFASAGSLDGSYEILYKGNMAKWKKFNAAVRMMMAIKMKDVDPTNGKARFAKAFADGSFESAADNLNYTFNDANSSWYAWFYEIGNMSYSGMTRGFTANKVIVDYLKEYKDPRMFTYFSLNGYMGNVEGDANNVDSYEGQPFGLASNAQVTEQASGTCSVAAKYCDAGATYRLITAARILLIEAEAAELGWISEDPKALYEAGIRASFETEGAKDVDKYLASAKVKLSDDKETAIEQIVTQRFLAGFLTDGVEAWADWRINNIPTIPVYEGQLDALHEVYPYRLEYTSTDMDYNKENVQAAINMLGSGAKNDRWVRLWWDVEDNTCPVGKIIPKIKWDEIGTADFTYATGWFADPDEPETDEGLVLYQQQQDPTIYKIADWGYGTDFTFQLLEDGKIIVPEQEIGYNHASYGPVRVVDYETHYGETDGPSYYDEESGLYKVMLCYIVDAGTFYIDYSWFTINADSRTVSVKKHSFVPKADVKLLNK